MEDKGVLKTRRIVTVDVIFIGKNRIPEVIFKRNQQVDSPWIEIKISRSYLLHEHRLWIADVILAYANKINSEDKPIYKVEGKLFRILFPKEKFEQKEVDHEN